MKHTLLVVAGVIGIVGGLSQCLNANYFQPPTFQTTFGLAVAVCSAISLIAGLATGEILKAMKDRGLDRVDRHESRHAGYVPSKGL